MPPNPTRSRRWLDILWRHRAYAVVPAGVMLCAWSVSKLMTAAYELRVYGSPYGFVDLQRARTPVAALKVLESWAGPKGTDLFVSAQDYAWWDFALLLGAALILGGLARAFSEPLGRARVTPGAGRWSTRFGTLVDHVLVLTIPAMILAVLLGGIASGIHWNALSEARAVGPHAAVGPATVLAGMLAYAKFLLVGFAIVVVTGSLLYLLSRNRSRRVKEFLDNNPPPSRRDVAVAHRGVTPERAESLSTRPGLLPELSPPVEALLHAREAHAVEARRRAERIFGAKDFIPFDTNRIVDEGKRRRLDNAPLGWVLSRTTQRILDDALCTNRDHVTRVMALLPQRAPGPTR